MTDTERQLSAQVKTLQLRVKELEEGVKKLRNQNYCSMCGSVLKGVK